MYKAWKVNLPDNIQSLLKVNKDNKYLTRKGMVKANCMTIVGVKLWNVLADDLKNCKTVLSFKRMLKAQYLAEY